MKTLLSSCLAAASLLGFTAAAAQAQTVITSLPYTITAGGLYVLNNNLTSTATSGSLITVSASNVTIDFQNHFIAGNSATLSSTQVYGISATERSNLTIRNGTVAYCSIGILITGNGTATTNAVDQQITNMRVTYCSAYGIDLEATPSSVISGCQVSQIGSTSNQQAIGINVLGAGVTAQGCTVSNIFESSGTNSYGIFSDTGSFTRQCQVSQAYHGVDSGIYQDNLFSGVTAAFDDGTDGGGNVVDNTPYAPPSSKAAPTSRKQTTVRH